MTVPVLVRVAAVAVLGYLVSGAAAQSKFNFKDPKGVNSMVFWLDSQVEPIMGVAAGVSGEVSFDPADPKKTTGTLVVDAKTLHVPNERMKDVLHGPDWLDVEKNPTIEFVFKEVKEAKKTGENEWELQVVGDFTCKGKTKSITIPVKASYLPGKVSARQRGEGDLLVLRTEFQVKRTDHGIKPEQNTAVVSDEIDIRASIVGMTAKS